MSTIDRNKLRNACQRVMELGSISGMKAKTELLKKYADDDLFTKLLYYALNPQFTYNLSEKTLRKTWRVGESMFKDIFECLDFLSRQKGINEFDTDRVRSFLNTECSMEEKEIYIKILSKTLRLGITETTVNKVIPGLIPIWDVQQAYSIEHYPAEDGIEFWLTQKLNGVRATYYNGKLIGRSGIPFEWLYHITDALEPFNDYVIDGELVLKTTDGLSDNEAFRIATGIINSDYEDKTEICFTVFDMLPKAEFDGDRSAPLNYQSRRNLLSMLDKKLTTDSVRVLPVLYHGTDTAMIDRLLEQMVAEDKEGLMLNYNTPYKRTRHKGILKIKRFYTMDLPIISFEEGTGRLSGTLGALVLDYKGNSVKVGSGFTDVQREWFWSNRNNLTGTICEVKYKEVSYDKKTKQQSLQFPVFVQIRNDKSEPSYD